ncbi:MAG: glycolate oxidase subunit GlcE [Alphaproteobacteria bacterium]
MAENLRPEDAQQVEEILAWAAGEETPLEVVGGGSKRGLGRPLQTAHEVDLSALGDVSLYEPEELVLAAGPGARLSDIELLLAEHNQQLAFEPPDLSALYGTAPAKATIGGTVACNLSGSRRIKAGAARDHLLGVHAVSGRGERFKTGGRVVKNVTGYDMCKLLTGSYGTLAVMTELTLKVLPVPEKTRTVLIYGLDEAAATRALTQALGSSHDVSGAAHMPETAAARSTVDHVRTPGRPVTAVRVEGVAASVAARCRSLIDALRDFGDREELHSANSRTLWREIGSASLIAKPVERVLWRISVPPRSGHLVAGEILKHLPGEAMLDWGGGLIWLSLEGNAPEAGHDTVRAALGSHGGHATLVRASEHLRSAVPVFQPQPEPLAALTRRIKESFDPRHILNPGRMYAGV